jgi:predicted permease
MRVRRLLLSGQVAITVAITIGAVLFGTTLRNVLSVDMGFDRNNVLLANVDLRHAPVAKPARVRFYTELSDRVRALGPAEAASLCIVTPISGRTWQFGAQVESSGGWQPFHTHYNAVTPEFFAAFGTRMVAGRPLSERDTPHAPPVALVNSAFARAAFGGETAIGRRVSFRDPEPRTVEIVGIVQDAKYRNLRTPVPPTLYVPFAQITEAPPFANLALRSHMPVEKVQRGLAALLSREYPDLSVKVTTLGEQVDSSVVQERTFAVIFALFGGLALCLAAAGVYGVLAYFVEQRRPELGIRIALGATTGDVRRLIYIQSFWALAAGTAAGTILALWGARFTSSMLFGVTPDQPEAYAVAIGVVAGIAVVATLIPAVRASRTEPMDLLRCE